MREISYKKGLSILLQKLVKVDLFPGRIDILMLTKD